ncbi:MAG: molecular chaperone DnaJ [Paenibacillaceae bacterium]|jgi:hypothetical protein|nr:molecular chaperone DnaJ [Paenibacillaceae bacterium]
MMDQKTAYSILGLEETATEEEVEQRYTVLLLRNRGRGADGEGNAPTMEEVNKAYNFIRGLAIQEEVRKNEPKNKTLGKIAYIWEYYRWHIFGTIAAVLIIFYTTTSIMDSRREEQRIERADLKVTIFADFQVENPDPFEVKLLENMKEWQDIHIVSQYAPIEPKDEYGMAMLQKAIVSMAADKADVYIMDKANFDKFGKQEAFLNLGEAPSLASIPNDKRINVVTDGGATYWAGVDITQNAALQTLKLPNIQKIAVVRINANKKDNAVKALEWMGQN